MKDFLKIFLVLCAVVTAFFFGRNYGEETKVESSEFKNLKSDNFNNKNAQEEITHLKEKFQKLLDSSDLKKSDEILGKIMTIFLADLSLQLTADQQKDLEIGQRACVMKPATTVKTETKVETSIVEEKKLVSKPEIKISARFKMGELEMSEARDVEDIRRALNKLEVRKIESLLDGAPESTFQQSKKFFGIYRGSILDVTGHTYGSIVFEIYNSPAEKLPIKGSIKLYRNGEVVSESNFTTDQLGSSPETSSSTILNVGPKHFLQVYKLESMQKIAGIYYEQLPQKTTKTIGTFILSRTDFPE